MTSNHLEGFRTFYEVARTGSLTKAAEALFVTQPSVSYAIKQLEGRMGVELFARKPKGVSLTAEGELLFRHVAEGLEAMHAGEQAIERYKRYELGEVRIGTSDTLCKYFLLPYLESFRRDYPDVRLQLSHGKTPDIVGWLKEGRIDLGMVHLPVPDDRLEIVELAIVQDRFIAGERYRHLADRPVPLREVFSHPLIVLSGNSHTRAFIESLAEAHGLALQPDIELGSVELLTEFARIGFGISFLSREFVLPQLEEGLLYELETEEPIPPRRIGIARMKGQPLPRAAARLLERLPSPAPAGE
ncbi:LysR family transcriptional regulator [Paenibacillus sp. TRM 82003]|nr:LysR family transcriptional regulator [Paenibacillus sp. TRM 82003]